MFFLHQGSIFYYKLGPFFWVQGLQRVLYSVQKKTMKALKQVKLDIIKLSASWPTNVSLKLHHQWWRSRTNMLRPSMKSLPSTIRKQLECERDLKQSVTTSISRHCTMFQCHMNCTILIKLRPYNISISQYCMSQFFFRAWSIQE